MLSPITPNNLFRVFAYQRLLKDAEEIKQEVYLFQLENDQDSSQKNPHLSHLEDCCQRNSGGSRRRRIIMFQKDDCKKDRIHHLHQLLQRFEVWSCKALAHHVLLLHHHETASEMVATCWSMLLGLPSTSYSSTWWLPKEYSHHASAENTKMTTPNHHKFGKIWSDIYNIDTPSEATTKNANQLHPNKHLLDYDPHYPCGLSVPPNLHTWRAYLRLSYMVTVLPKQATH